MCQTIAQLECGLLILPSAGVQTHVAEGRGELEGLVDQGGVEAVDPIERPGVGLGQGPVVVQRLGEAIGRARVAVHFGQGLQLGIDLVFDAVVEVPLEGRLDLTQHERAAVQDGLMALLWGDGQSIGGLRLL